MNPSTRERIERWETGPFSGGFKGLADLETANFSGMVSAAGTALFMLNGRIVGVVGGDIDDFDGADGTCYEAPDPGLPLLFAMQEGDGETRAKYYTQKTPLSEVDQTLREGSFTGYVELSEDVLSGDYYVAYYGGRALPVAYIGTSERLLTGEEAFERADDEVGIYEVVDVDVAVVEIPGAGGTSGASSTTGGQKANDGDRSDTGQSGGSDDPTASAAEAVEPESATGNRTEASGSGDSFGETDDASTGGTGSHGRSVDANANTSTGTKDTAKTDVSDRHVSSAVDSGEERSDADRSDHADRSKGDVAQSTSDAVGGSPSEPDDSRDTSHAGTPTTDTGDGNQNDGTVTETESASNSAARNAGSVDAATEGNSGSRTAGGVDSTTATNRDSRPGGSASGPVDRERDLEERLKEEEQWRETRSIPSIDPDHSEANSTSSTDGTARGGTAETARTEAPRKRSAVDDGTSRSTSKSTEPATQSADRRTGGPGGSRPDRTPATSNESPEQASPLREDMLEREDEIDRLTQRVEALEREERRLEEERSSLESERDDLAAENRKLATELERMKDRLSELERQTVDDRPESTAADSSAGTVGTVSDGPSLSGVEALSGTNLFVRYDSKSAPTLESAHRGDADATAVQENLRLEHHTTFDVDGATVGDEPYESYLESTLEYRFVEWLIKTLPFEIRDTGNAAGLRDLYDAFPTIDRAELQADVTVEPDDGDPISFTFDVVVRDKRGAPLVLANLNDSRQPATEEMLEALEEAATSVGYDDSSLAAAFVVTASFFEPAALETVEGLTGSGFLSRDAKRSYVKLARKSGYHLCLVEARNGGFHVSVPEL